MCGDLCRPFMNMTMFIESLVRTLILKMSSGNSHPEI